MVLVLVLEGRLVTASAELAVAAGGTAARVTLQQKGRRHLLEGHTWILWYWCVLLMTFWARMLKQ